MAPRASVNISFIAFLVGLVAFGFSTTWLSGSFLFPLLGVAAVAAIVSIIFGHRGFAQARREGSGSGFALTSLALGYLLLLVSIAWGALILFAVYRLQ
jgi:hypothetical protein